MAISSKQIGWSQESSLLWEILRDLDQLTKVTSKISGGGGGSGSVNSFSFTNGNGFTGTVANPTSTPALSLLLQNASATQAGQLSAADWTIFNNKIGLSSLSASSPISYNTSTGAITFPSWPSNSLGVLTNDGSGTLSWGDVASLTTPENLQTGTSYTLVLTDIGKIITTNTASSNTVTIPLNASVNFPTGKIITVYQKGSGLTTINGVGGVTINYPSGGNATTGGQGGVLNLWQESTDVWSVWNGLPLGNLSISNFNSGTGASGNTFWRGDGTWSVPFSLTTTGSSGAATFSSGSLNIPTYTIAGLGGWSLASGGTLTGVNTITSNAPDQLLINGTFTATANNQHFATGTRNLTSRSTASDNLWDTQQSTTFNINSTGINAIGRDLNITYVQMGGVNTTVVKTQGASGMTPGTYTLVSATSTSGSGTGAVFTVVIGSATSATSVTPTTAGSGYKVNETLTFNGSLFGAGTGSFVFTINSVTGSNLGTNATPLRVGITGENFNQAPKLIDFAYEGSSASSIRWTSFGGNQELGFYDGTSLNFFYSNLHGSVFNKALTAQSTLTVAGTSSLGGQVTFLNKANATAGLGLAYSAKTANYTLGINDFLIECTTGSFTITLPDATSVNITKQFYVISNTGAGTITLATTASQTIDGSAPGTLTAGTKIRVMSNGANWISW